MSVQRGPRTAPPRTLRLPNRRQARRPVGGADIRSGPSRDAALDAARVLCLVCVVSIHILMVTLTTDPATGAVANVMAPTEAGWYPWASWAVQVMPLFFVVGGCASAISWARHRARGGGGPSWVRGRLLRLALPGALLWAVLALAAAAATAAGVPRQWVAAALQGLGMHLWFLGAYVVCLVAVPWLHARHTRRPRTTIGLLILAVAGIETLRILLADPWWGLLGLAVVWPAIQQIGFFRHDGSFARTPSWALALIGLLSLGLLAATTAAPWWGEDALSTLNPPTICMVLLGIAQACALQLLSPVLERLMALRPMVVLAWLVGSRALTLYLWHLPVIVAVMAAWWLLEAPDPAPGSAGWWLWRIPLGVLCWVLVLLVVQPLGRLESRAAPAPVDDGGALHASWPVVLIAAAAVVTPAVLEIRYLLSPPLTTAGAAAMILAVVLLSRRPAGAPGPRGETSTPT